MAKTILEIPHGNSLTRNPVPNHIQRLCDFRNDCLKALSRNPAEQNKQTVELDCFWDGFWVFYPEYKPYSKMAQLALCSESSMNAYYNGKREIPVDTWKIMLINAINHINADQLSIAVVAGDSHE